MSRRLAPPGPSRTAGLKTATRCPTCSDGSPMPWRRPLFFAFGIGATDDPLADTIVTSGGRAMSRNPFNTRTYRVDAQKGTAAVLTGGARRAARLFT